MCTSLEPGRDGVGDYTRRVAAECAIRDHDVPIVALNDQHIDDRMDETIGGVPTLRLSQHLPWEVRIRETMARVSDFGPDWLSWQFVPYGFHPKGLPQPALLDLAQALGGTRSHIMLHELWNNLSIGEPARLRLVGWIQRRGILKFLKELAPTLVHTSNETYAAALARESYHARVLPLFGNVPIASAPTAVCRTKASGFLPGNPSHANGNGDTFFIGATFGTLHPQWKPESTAIWMRKTAAELGRQPALLITGRAGHNARLITDIFSKAGVTAVETGEQDVSTISSILQGADFGIATSPWALLGKSGAASAMRDHGLPVLVPRDDWRLRKGAIQDSPKHSLFARLSDLETPEITARWLSSRRSPQSILSSVVDDLLAQMKMSR
ncbi:MAG TPA: glycosyltransferase [Chthoniobacterales bacterium]